MITIINKNLNLLYMDKGVKKMFTPNPMISFCCTEKLSSYLVRAKLYPKERIAGFFRCGGKRCDVCRKVNEASIFTSRVTGKTV